MGTIKTTNIETITGSGTLTLGQSGETVSVPSGATLDMSSATTTLNSSMKNTPAFFVSKTSSVNGSSGSTTKATFNLVDFDTDSAYDSTTNYRFTVPTGKAGKYFIYSRLTLDSNGTGSDYIILTLYKNGSRVFASRFYEGGVDLDEPSVSLNITLDLAESDYLELYGTMAIGSGNPTIKLTSDSAYLNWFGAYKIIE